MIRIGASWRSCPDLFSLGSGWARGVGSQENPRLSKEKLAGRKLDGMDDVEMPSSRENYSSAIEK
eukprot:4997873-Karenia_brevis.AAC.1